MNIQLFIVKVLMLSCVIGLAVVSAVGPETLQQTSINTPHDSGHGMLSHTDVTRPTQSFLEIIFSSH